MRRVGLLLGWVGFIVYAIAFAPPDQSSTVELIEALVLGQWSQINPLIVALFNVMGLWPVIYAAVALADGRSQSFPVWPFVAASFGLGAFALLPYLALRQSSASFEGELGRWIKLLESRWVAIGVFLFGTGLLGYGFIVGSWSDFVAQWQTSRFIHVMSLDFCVLSMLFPFTLLRDDMARRGLQQFWIWGLVAIAPFVGPALYLCLRPPLKASPSSGNDHSGYPSSTLSSHV